jgi:hypothetical protein
VGAVPEGRDANRRAATLREEIDGSPAAFPGADAGYSQRPDKKEPSMSSDAPTESDGQDPDAATTEYDPNEDQDSEPTNTAPAGERPMDNPSES